MTESPPPPSEPDDGDLSPSPPGAPQGFAGPAAVAETHVGVVFFLGDRAYKLKKPVDLGFVDFRSREARSAACHSEVALNRRIAPDVYLGVADVSGEDGRVCDHLVVMRRMPAKRRLSALVTAGEAVEGELTRLAQLLAGFHDRCDRWATVDEAASRDAQLRRWEANATEMERFVGDILDPDVAVEVMRLARRYLEGRRKVFDRRIADGRACDGHGDLLADDIFCLEDGPRVLDCLEFDEHLRHGDVLADVAFLAMDLERLGRSDLGSFFLDEYRRASGDDWPSSLAHHYVAYRAQVRAKVACLRAGQGDEPSRLAARELLALCLRHLDRAQVRMVLVGGGPGTGKSTVSRALATELGASVLRSDEIRKELAGIDRLAHEPAGLDEGLYDPSVTRSTYAELLSRAEEALSSGQTVVLDASWRDPLRRDEAAGLAAQTASELVVFRCVAPLDTVLERVEARMRSGADPSEATPEIARALSAAEQPWPAAIDLDTTVDLSRTVAAALDSIGGDGAGG